MHRIDLFAPEIEGQTATFRWRITPDIALYQRPSFQLTFPDTVDLTRVPARLWWDVALICLHPQWLVIRPCEIHLPLRLSPGEKRFWLQFFQTAAETLESTRTDERTPPPLGIEIVDGNLDVPHVPIAGAGVAAAFSSGKDSLLQAALLFELTERPLLVATTSPLPPLADHDTARRREIFAAIKARRDPLFVEVVSDLRANWDNGFAGQYGYFISINELTDTFLYMANLLVAAAALGRTRLFLASETEVQENEDVDGVIIQHPHFMYSAATQRSLAHYLEPYGLRFGSLIWPLYSLQVQQLLWARYPDLSDLQYSCWRVGLGQNTCSSCEQCMRIAMTAMAKGYNPERMGIDLDRLMAHAPDWEPVRPVGAKVSGPQTVAARRSRSLVVGNIQRTPPARFMAIAVASKPSRLFSRAGWRLLESFRKLRARVADLPAGPQLGVREAFIDWIDPDLREPLRAIFKAHFPSEARAMHAGIFERSATLTERARSALYEPAP